MVYIKTKTTKIGTFSVFTNIKKIEPSKRKSDENITVRRFVRNLPLSMIPATNGWPITERIFDNASARPTCVLLNPLSKRKTAAYA